MRKHCGNCANHRKETNAFSEECEMCVQAVFENGEKTDPSHWREKPQTNADRIRAMSDEELAEYLAEIGSEANNGVIYSDRPEEWLEYLQQPADMRGEEDG